MINTETGYPPQQIFSTNLPGVHAGPGRPQKKPGSKLILDLRGNGSGGVLDEAVEIADEFSLDDKLITYTEAKAYRQKGIPLPPAESA